MSHTRYLQIAMSIAILATASFSAPKTALGVDFDALRQTDGTPTAEKPSADSSHDSDEEDAPQESEPSTPQVNANLEFSQANRLASAGAISRAIPHYENVLKAAPDKFVQAYFNLAEVYRLKGECKKSVLLYSIYMAHEVDKDNLADAQKARNLCLNGHSFGTLDIAVEPTGITTLLIDGYIANQGGGVDALQLINGDYSVEARADEHIAQTATVTVSADKSVTHKFKLEKKLFFGSLHFGVNKKGATITIHPKELDSNKAPTKTISLTSPVSSPLKLATGKYFIEVTLASHNRWIRNVVVQRDSLTDVDIALTPGLPEAIRPK